jgi:hypothetical protein
MGEIILETLDGLREKISQEFTTPSIYRQKIGRAKYLGSTLLGDYSMVYETNEREYLFQGRENNIPVFVEREMSNERPTFKHTITTPPPSGKIVFGLIATGKPYDNKIIMLRRIDNNFPEGWSKKKPKHGWLWMNAGHYCSEPEHFPYWIDSTDFPLVPGDKDWIEKEAKAFKESQQLELEEQKKELQDKLEYVENSIKKFKP